MLPQNALNDPAAYNLRQFHNLIEQQKAWKSRLFCMSIIMKDSPLDSLLSRHNGILGTNQHTQMTAYTFTSIKLWYTIIKTNCLMSAIITGNDTPSAAVTFIKIKGRE